MRCGWKSAVPSPNAYTDQQIHTSLFLVVNFSHKKATSFQLLSCTYSVRMPSAVSLPSGVSQDTRAVSLLGSATRSFTLGHLILGGSRSENIIRIFSPSSGNINLGFDTQPTTGHAQSSVLSCVWLFVTPWTVAYQAPLSMIFPRGRILKWVAISFSRGSSWPRDWTLVSCISCIGRQVLYHCTIFAGAQSSRCSLFLKGFFTSSVFIFLPFTLPPLVCWVQLFILYWDMHACSVASVMSDCLRPYGL